MARHVLSSVALAAALAALPAYAADTGGTANSPAAANPAAPAPNATAGSAATTSRDHGPAATYGAPGGRNAPAGSSASSASSVPKYTTSDDQVRVGKLVGASVYNDKGDTVGSIDDVLMSHDNKATTAVISVGGFLGIGNKLVSVPLDQLKVEKDKIVMPGATQDALKGMPEYKYNNA